MAKKIVYWVSTVIVAGSSLLTAYAYLSASPQMVQAFTHVGYPQQLRILLGIAKALGAIALLIPGFPILKEWSYAGFTFAWIAAHVAHHIAKDGFEQYAPLILLVILFISYFTRPEGRRTG